MISSPFRSIPSSLSPLPSLHLAHSATSIQRNTAGVWQRQGLEGGCGPNGTVNRGGGEVSLSEKRKRKGARTGGGQTSEGMERKDTVGSVWRHKHSHLSEVYILKHAITISLLCTICRQLGTLMPVCTVFAAQYFFSLCLYVVIFIYRALGLIDIYMENYIYNRPSVFYYKTIVSFRYSWWLYCCHVDK